MEKPHVTDHCFFREGEGEGGEGGGAWAMFWPFGGQ